MTGIVPTNAYPCRPDPEAPTTPIYVVIGANGDTIYTRLMNAIDRPDLTGPAYQQNHHRIVKQAEIEEGISNWTKRHTAEEVIAVMNSAGVPVGRVLNVQDIVNAEQTVAREAVHDVWVDGGKHGEGWNVKMQATFPLIEGCDTKPKWAGPDLGYHTNEVLTGNLGLSEAEVDKLRNDGIIG